jgi:hypothetical protein
MTSATQIELQLMAQTVKGILPIVILFFYELAINWYLWRMAGYSNPETRVHAGGEVRECLGKAVPEVLMLLFCSVGANALPCVVLWQVPPMTITVRVIFGGILAVGILSTILSAVAAYLCSLIRDLQDELQKARGHVATRKSEPSAKPRPADVELAV